MSSGSQVVEQLLISFVDVVLGDLDVIHVTSLDVGEVKIVPFLPASIFLLVVSDK